MWSDCDGSGDKWPSRDDNGECCPNQYLAGAPVYWFLSGSRGASPEPEPRDAELSVMSAPCPMLLGIPRPPPPLTHRGNVSPVPSIPTQHTQAFYNPPAPVSALLIDVTREATWPVLPQASGDWEPETRDKFSETGSAQRGGGTWPGI